MSRRNASRIFIACILTAVLSLPNASPATVLAAPIYPPQVPITFTTMNAMAMPAYRTPVIEANYGTTVQRIADKTTFTNAATITFEPNNLRHYYAKKQPWNADGSLMILDYFYPSALLNGQTYELIRMESASLTAGFPCEGSWSNIDPNKAYGRYCGSQYPSNQLLQWNVTTGARTVVYTFTEYVSFTLGNYEGNISNDDQYAPIIGKKSDNTYEVVVFNLATNQVVSRLNVGSTNPNNATMSQSGNYVVIQWDASGSGASQGTNLYDRNLVFQRQLSTHGGFHFDMCYNTTGQEVMTITNDNSTSEVVATRLDTGAETVVLTAAQAGYNIHISCRNLQRPGWAYVSQFGNQNNDKATFQSVFSVKLDGSGVGEFFAKEHHSANDTYPRSPMAVPNRDGSTVVWASDWGNRRNTAPVYSYVAYQQ